MQGWLVIPVSLAYLGVLFLIAWYGDRQTRWLANWRPWIYSLSIAVYCTSWTFYGTVGQASVNPWSFLPIYIAPILMFVFGWRVLARLILIAKREHITSLADFIAARYGKSQGLAVAVTVIAVLGILPYIALQLRGITMGLNIVAPDLMTVYGYQESHVSWFVVLALALFTMLFGTRHIDNTEHHRGMMMAIAFESIVKLVAFLCVGVFIAYLAWRTDGLELSTIAASTYQAPNWPTLLIHTLLTMIAIVCLPRQFHTMVVENERPQDLHTARWLFPVYLLLMSLFVLPIAWTGQGLLPNTSPDTFVISLPVFAGAHDIALLAFLGGTSAASGMVIVSTIALAIMVSNDLVMPLLLRRMRLSQRTHRHFSGLLVVIRRTLILLLLFGAWGFYLVLDSIPSLSAIGFLSFSAITQFAPAIFGGMYWREGNRKGVYVGLAVGFTLWLITLMSATDMLAGDASNNVLLWVITPPDWLVALGLKSADWGMLLSVTLNTLCYIGVSLVTRASLSERLQAAAFVGTPLPENENMSLYQSRVTVGELEMLASRFVGRTRVRNAFAQYWSQQRETLLPNQQASSALIRHNAQQGLCGPGDPEDHVRRRVYHLEQGTSHTSSRVRADGRVIEVQGNPMPGGGFVMSFTDITVFREAEQSLKMANETLEERVLQRTLELEKLNKQLVTATQRSERESQSKSRFLAAVSHDLMQPLNAARLFASSLSEVAKEAEVQKLAHHIESALGAAEDLISDLLDISRLESGKIDLHPHSFAIMDVLSNLNAEFSALAAKQGVQFSLVPSLLWVHSDPKLLRRVIQNFLTNAFRYNPNGKVILGVRRVATGQVRIDVWDNGIGIEQDKQQEIFEEFNRGGQVRSDQGLGLGLAISKGIAHVLGHHISMRSWPGQGSVFSITLDRAQPMPSSLTQTVAMVNEKGSELQHLRVLCVDNEPDILVGMRDLLERWGCEVKTATDIHGSLKALEGQWIPDVILSDYRLDNGRTGLEVLQQCRLRLGDCFAGVIISADRNPDILDGIESSGFRFMAKPIKPLKLRALLNSLS
ncbi:TPA: hybrid sensor histidine kinase/response regulator [Vibrio cholerae]|nr:hybrid sensor histidine kinase/response regulator [Vibrio cholerae]HAS4354769.1 hybrid sensor histidine kinase/response regulator [Vibrio cholerae]HAS5161529.1 hybrid sensor histidine kinase/response regulator [Vibrio cholerae]